MLRIGLDCAKSRTVHTLEMARAADEIGKYPLLIRPSFTWAGRAGIAYNKEEFDKIVANGLDISPVHEILVEGASWLERSTRWRSCAITKDQCVSSAPLRTSIPWACTRGLHNGRPRDEAHRQGISGDARRLLRPYSRGRRGDRRLEYPIRRGSQGGRMVVIEMNPRVSSPPGSRCPSTGFPIAKIAAKLAVAYALDEIRNDITRLRPRLRPTIDYGGDEVPRFTFEKFPDADVHASPPR